MGDAMNVLLTVLLFVALWAYRKELGLAKFFGDESEKTPQDKAADEAARNASTQQIQQQQQPQEQPNQTQPPARPSQPGGLILPVYDALNLSRPITIGGTEILRWTAIPKSIQPPTAQEIAAGYQPPDETTAQKTAFSWLAQYFEQLEKGPESVTRYPTMWKEIGIYAALIRPFWVYYRYLSDLDEMMGSRGIAAFDDLLERLKDVWGVSDRSALFNRLTAMLQSADVGFFG